jgi:hypothetical protein
MNKVYNLKKLSFNKFDVLACVYFLFMINQGIHIEALSMGRLKLLEIIPISFLMIASIKNFFFNFNKTIKYIYLSLFILLLFSFISAFHQESIRPILYVSAFVLLIVTFLNFSNNSNITDEDILKLFKYILLINFIILLACLIFGDTKYLSLDGFYRYRGIFYNSNQLGRFCSVTIILGLFPLFDSYLKLGKVFKFICLINLTLATILLLYSNSRLSILVVVVAILCLLILYFSKIINNIKKFYNANFFIKIVILFFGFSLLVSFCFIILDPMISLMNKFLDPQIVKARGGLTSYRFDYLLASLDYLNFFGYHDYKSETSICIDTLKYTDRARLYNSCEVHNTYLSFWLKIGFYLPFFLFYGLLSVFLFSVTFSDNNPTLVFISKLVTVMTVVLIVYYLFETGIMHIFFILDLILVSYLIK